MKILNRVFAVVVLCVLPQAVGAIPLEIKKGEMGAGEVSIWLEFDGVKRSVKLDSGSDALQLARADWNRGYAAIDQVQGLGASGIAFDCDIISFKNVSAAEFRRTDVPSTRCNEGVLDLVGLSFFAENTLYFDFENGNLDINDSQRKGALPFKTYPAGHVGLNVQLGDQSIFAVFDTAAGLTAVDQPYVDAHQSLFEFVQEAAVLDGSGQPVPVKIYKIKALEINGFQMEGEYVLAFDMGPLRDYFGSDTPLVLGFNVLSKFKWTLDLKNKLWSMNK